MPRDLVFLPEVETDISEAYWWYENKDVGLGNEFIRCLEEAFSRVSSHPEHFPVRFDDVRKFWCADFPMPSTSTTMIPRSSSVTFSIRHRTPASFSRDQGIRTRQRR
jgi:hypothetical protein